MIFWQVFFYLVKKLNIKIIIFVVLIFITGNNAFSNYSIQKNHKTDIKFIDKTKLKYYPITFNVQSQTIYIDGCWATFTCTITFEWSPETGPTNMQFSNANIDWNCPGGETYFIRGFSVSADITSRTIQSVNFIGINDVGSNKLINLEAFNKDIISKINDGLLADY